MLLCFGGDPCGGGACGVRDFTVDGYAYKRAYLVALRNQQDFGERSAIDVVAGEAVRARWYVSLPKNTLQLT
jgi:hypothetical protein